MATNINHPAFDDSMVGPVDQATAVGDLCWMGGIVSHRPQFVLAPASDAAILTRRVYYCLGKAIVGGAALLNDEVRLMCSGVIEGLVYPAGAPSVYDPVYVDDTQQLSLSVGTNPRQVAIVIGVDVVPGTYDVWFDGRSYTF